MSKPAPIKQALALPIAPVTASSVKVISRDGSLSGVSITVGYGSGPTFDKVTTGILSIVYGVEAGKNYPDTGSGVFIANNKMSALIDHIVNGLHASVLEADASVFSGVANKVAGVTGSRPDAAANVTTVSGKKSKTATKSKKSKKASGSDNAEVAAAVAMRAQIAAAIKTAETDVEVANVSEGDRAFRASVAMVGPRGNKTPSVTAVYVNADGTTTPAPSDGTPFSSPNKAMCNLQASIWLKPTKRGSKLSFTAKLTFKLLSGRVYAVAEPVYTVSDDDFELDSESEEALSGMILSPVKADPGTVSEDSSEDEDEDDDEDDDDDDDDDEDEYEDEDEDEDEDDNSGDEDEAEDDEDEVPAQPAAATRPLSERKRRKTAK